MQYRTLGRTGVQVSSLALGAMNFGTMGGTSQDDATAIVDAALEAGVNLVDTADHYSRGESEQLVGKAIGGRPDDIVLATKALDAIDTVVAPGVDLAPDEKHDTPPALLDPSLRRR